VLNNTDNGVITGGINGFTLLGLSEGYNWTVNVTDDED